MTKAKLTWYELKCAQMAKLPKLSKEGYKNGKKMLDKLKNKFNNLHYMMLCNELRYYTVLVSCPCQVCNDKFSDVIIECAESVGEILDINFDETKTAVQIWIRTAPEEVHAVMVFPYDAGVVQFGA